MYICQSNKFEGSRRTSSMFQPRFPSYFILFTNLFNFSYTTPDSIRISDFHRSFYVNKFINLQLRHTEFHLSLPYVPYISPSPDWYRVSLRAWSERCFFPHSVACGHNFSEIVEWARRVDRENVINITDNSSRCFRTGISEDTGGTIAANREWFRSENLCHLRRDHLSCRLFEDTCGL